MTVSYNDAVATGGKGIGNFLKVLFRWKGSIYKLVLPDLILYILFYYGINLVHRLWITNLDEDDLHRIRFHSVVHYCEDVVKYIPLQFLLAFYVAQIVTRWWSQYMATPWPDAIAVITAITLHGHDDRARLMRRTILRYVNLCILITFVLISPQARKRFPSMDHMVAAGLLMQHEKEILEELEAKTDLPKYFVPIVWASSIASKARKEERIRDDIALYHIIKTLCTVRLCAGDLLSYDWISFPLVYTQVVTLAVYIYFIAYALARQQFENPDAESLDVYVPVFTFLDFFFMLGWLKVAEVLINPFGEDDDDFEVNWLIDRNLQTSYLIVDEMNTSFPEMLKDEFWDDVIPDTMYYTRSSLKYKSQAFTGSAAKKLDKEALPKETESLIVQGGAVFVHHHHHPVHEDVSITKDMMEHNYILKKKDSLEELAAVKEGT